MIPQSFDRTYADQASKFASRVPIPFDRVVSDILRYTAPTHPDVAAEQLEAVVSQAERGRAWHPAMGQGWPTADQAAQR